MYCKQDVDNKVFFAEQVFLKKFSFLTNVGVDILLLNMIYSTLCYTVLKNSYGILETPFAFVRYIYIYKG